MRSPNWVLAFIIASACGGSGAAGLTGPTPPPLLTASPGPQPSPTSQSTASPRPGVLDAAFGSGGIVVLDFPGLLFAPLGARLDRQDNVVVLARSFDPDHREPAIALLRVRSDGAPDGTFGNAGFVDTAVASAIAPCGETSCSAAPHSVLPLADDRILVSGSIHSAALSPNETQGVLVLYRHDGALDDGVPGGIDTPTFENEPLFLWDLKEDALGRIVAAGATRVARLLGDLSPDLAFGVAGIDVAPPRSTAFLVATRRDGSIVAAGSLRVSESYSQPDVIAFGPNGSVATAFGDGGHVGELPRDLTPFAVIDQLAVDSRDRVVLVIRNGRDLLNRRAWILRLSATGALDRDFGDEGVVQTEMSVSGLTALSDDGILVAGSSAEGAVLARYDDRGRADPGFGTDGRAGVPPHAGQITDFFAIGIDGEGRIVAVGTTQDAAGPRRLLLARYLLESSGL